MFLSDNGCHNNESLSGKCSTYATDGGCRICSQGFYKHEKTCMECMPECRTCMNGDSCVTCDSAHFMTVDGVCKGKDQIIGCAVDISSDEGCTECVSGYFVNDRECVPCNMSHALCVVCDWKMCLDCVSDHLLANGECVHFTNVSHCSASDGSKCVKCAFWHVPTIEGDKCMTRVVWWVVVLAVLCVLFVLGVFIASTAVCANGVMKHVRRQRQREKACVFKMSHSNVSFSATRHSEICVNKTTVVFGDGAIPVCCESEEFLCIGNRGKRDVKVQLVAKEGSDKFTIRSNPSVMTLRCGFACEFEVFITPLCSTVIDDKVMIVVQECGALDSFTIPVCVKAETEVTTRLHYDDVICEKQIGEGSFGVVFIGTFRGDCVAIKKMKDVDASRDTLDEFSKEVGMLDKFRCDQIVHFYGACTIQNHVMMVTEFAPCGSLMDCIQKHVEPSFSIRVKVMFDAAKGMRYLHENGILHRDIKPDNILVFSMDDVIDVNGKLTDFGSSRNINMLMTNMTFTKGIGTPVYMAPEVLNKDKYKKGADVYSFGVTLFECFKWGEAYQKTLFKYPWDIVSFVNGGKRIVKPPGMSDNAYHLVSECWCQNPSARIGLPFPIDI